MNRLVALVNTGRYNQLLRLPSKFTYNGADYRIVHLPEDYLTHTFHGKGFDCAFDMVIQPSFNELQWSDFNAELRTVNLNRYDKIHQQRLLHDFIEKHKTPPVHYHHLNTFPIDLDTKQFGPFEGEGVIKLVDGARSMGIMKFDTQRTNLRSFFTRLRRLIDDKESTNEDLGKLCLQFEIDLTIGEEYHENETIDQFRESSLAIQELNPFVAKSKVLEFRALKTLDRVMIFHRDHFQDKNPNLIDSSIEDVWKAEVGEHHRHLLEEIYQTIRDKNFPLIHGSIDIWISLEDQAWGIYEYQTQYGHNFIPETKHNEFILATIDLLYRELNAN